MALFAGRVAYPRRAMPHGDRAETSLLPWFFQCNDRLGAPTRRAEPPAPLFTYQIPSPALHRQYDLEPFRSRCSFALGLHLGSTYA